MKNYVILTPYFPIGNSICGTFVYDQVRAITRTKKFVRIEVLMPVGWFKRRLDYEYGGTTVHGIRMFAFPSKILPDFFDFINRRFFFRRLRQLGLEGDVDIFHIHTSPLAKFGVWLKKRIPSVNLWLQHHDLDPMLIRIGRLQNCRWHQKLVIRRRIENASQMDRHIGVSNLALRQLEVFPGNAHDGFDDYDRKLKLVSDLPHVRIKSASVLYNGCDTELFFPSNTRNAANVLRIGCVAGFYEWKGQMTLLRALSLVRHPYHLTFVGNGSERKPCEEYVKAHGLASHVDFRDALTHDRLVPFYRSVDLMVLPSTFEAMGCVYLEAAACGVPFICCRGQGCEELVSDDDRNRWVVNPDDPDDLAAKINAFAQERTRAQKLSTPFSIDILVSRFLAETGVAE